MNIRFVIRGLVLSLPPALLVVAGWVWLQAPWLRPPDPTPPPPTIQVPAGYVPDSPVGHRVWARYRDGDSQPASSGFLLQLDLDTVIGVTAAHTVSLGDANRPLVALAFTDPGSGEMLAVSGTLLGKPGHLLAPTDLSVDYLLLLIGPV